jgi:hypothetical protein
MIPDCTATAPETLRTRHPLALRLQCRKEWVEGQGALAEIGQKHATPKGNAPNLEPKTLQMWGDGV